MSLSTNLVLTTELDAVNVLLATIGEAPVNTLSDSTLPDVATARSALRNVSRRFQSKGWDWNREEEFPLAPDDSGQISLPSNLLSLDISHLLYPGYRFVNRGTKLYDKKNHTYSISQTIYATVVFFLPFEQLSQPCREYITMAGAHLFQKWSVGSETLFGFTAEEIRAAWIAAVGEEAENADYNILYGTNDSPRRTYDVGSIHTF